MNAKYDDLINNIIDTEDQLSRLESDYNSLVSEHEELQGKLRNIRNKLNQTAEEYNSKLTVKQNSFSDLILENIKPSKVINVKAPFSYKTKTIWIGSDDSRSEITIKVLRETKTQLLLSFNDCTTIKNQEYKGVGNHVIRMTKKKFTDIIRNSDNDIISAIKRDIRIVRILK